MGHANLAFGVAAVALVISLATTVSATVCNDRCFDLACGRRFPNGIAGRTVPSNVRMTMDLRCGDLLHEDVPRFPNLSTVSGQPIDSNWVEVSSTTDDFGTSMKRFVRDGPELPADAEIVVTDTWNGNCVLAIRENSCSGGSAPLCGAESDGGCCAQTPGAIRELFRFGTTARDDQPPSYVPVMNIACRGYGSPDSTAHVVQATFSDFAGATDVVTIELYVRRPSAAFDFSRPVARWTSHACWAAGDMRSFIGESFGAPLGWFDTRLPQIPDYTGEWRFVAVAFDEAGNTNPGPEAALILPVDCSSTFVDVSVATGFESRCDTGNGAGTLPADVERSFADIGCAGSNQTFPVFTPPVEFPSSADAGVAPARSPDAGMPSSIALSPVDRGGCTCALSRQPERTADAGVALFALLGIRRRGRRLSAIRKFVVLVCAGAVSMVQACGSSDAGGAGGGASSNAEQFIKDYCATISGCCVGKTFDSTLCTSSFQGQASGNQFDPAAASTCLDGLRAAQTAGTLCDWRTSVRDPCQVVFTGTKQPGETCKITIPTECAPSAEGRVTCFQSTAEQICELLIDGKEGDSPCINTHEGTRGYGSPWNGAAPARGYLCETSKGLLCDRTTKACAKAPTVGSPCDGSVSGYSCGADAYCDKTTTTCVARPAAGGDCGAPGVICAMGTYCDNGTKKCTVLLTDGAACTTNESCTSGACLQSTCGGDNKGFQTVYCK